ncbi:MAG: DNA alkylation repair protein [Clostridiaceae bacterium]
MTKYENIKYIFEENRDEKKAAEMAAYMKDRFLFYGIQSPLRKQITKEVIKQDKKSKYIDWGFLDECYEDEHREFHYFVIDYLDAMKSHLKYEDIEHMYKFIKMHQWWDTIDNFDTIIGTIGLTDSRVDSLMLQWSVDDDMWLRRLAIDHQLLRKEKTDKKLLSAIILNNLDSREFFINKAIGWSLRDYSKTNPQWVAEFIEQHKEHMAPLSIREGSKYL